MKTNSFGDFLTLRNSSNGCFEVRVVVAQVERVKRAVVEGPLNLNVHLHTLVLDGVDANEHDKRRPFQIATRSILIATFHSLCEIIKKYRMEKRQQAVLQDEGLSNSLSRRGRVVCVVS